MDKKKQKQFAHELKMLVAKHMKSEIDLMVEGLWEDGDWSDSFMEEEDKLLKDHDMYSGENEIREERHDLYIDSFSQALTDISRVLIESLNEMQAYPHKIYEDGVCIAKFHNNAETEANILWEEVIESTDDLSAKFETIDENGNEVTKTLD